MLDKTIMEAGILAAGLTNMFPEVVSCHSPSFAIIVRVSAAEEAGEERISENMSACTDMPLSRERPEDAGSLLRDEMTRGVRTDRREIKGITGRPGPDNHC